MHRITLSILSLLAAMTVLAADISPLTRLLIKQKTAPQRHEMRAFPMDEGDGEDGEDSDEPDYTHFPLMLQISGDEILPILEEMGVVIYGHRIDILAAAIPVDRLSEVLALEGIRYASATGDMSSCLDKARQVGRVDMVHAGSAEFSPFDGTGVVTGFCDIGFDNTHPAFADRVAEIHKFEEYHGTLSQAVTPTEVAEWTTDDPDNFHATHVANILAGCARLNQYDGVATGSQIVATTSDLTDVGIAAGIEAIIDYAQSVGKPAAINVSLSNHLGPRDGTDLFARYLASCAEDAVICFSAGNSGHHVISASHDFTAKNSVAAVTFNSLHNWVAFDVFGITDVWCSDDSPLEVSVGVYDYVTGKMVYTAPWVTDESISFEINNDNDAEWDKYMIGKFAVYGELCPLNNRFNITAQYDYTTTEYVPDKKYSRYRATLLVKAPEGRHVDFYTDAVHSYLATPTGFATRCGAQGSINNMCTAKGIVCVGAMSSRNEVPLIDGTIGTLNFTADNVAKFSSYAQLPTVKPLPHFCAPGNYIVSAVSSAYMENNPGWYIADQKEVNGTTYTWMAECGTSMASPYAAGVFALWLQANPYLTPDELLEIAVKTARKDFSDISDPRWGAGEIDALAGLRRVFDESQVTGIDRDLISVGDYSLFDLQGHRHNLPADFDPLEPSKSLCRHLSKGVYILTHPLLPTRKISI